MLAAHCPLSVIEYVRLLTLANGHSQVISLAAMEVGNGLAESFTGTALPLKPSYRCDLDFLSFRDEDVVSYSNVCSNALSAMQR